MMEEAPKAVPGWADGVARGGLYASLEHRPNTPEAVALGKTLAGLVIDRERQSGKPYQRKGTKLAQFREAAGRFAADLLRAQASKLHGGRCYRSMQKAKFTGAVSYLHFKALVEGLVALALVKRTPGYRRGTLSAFDSTGGRGDLNVNEAWAATFEAESSFLAAAEAVGVTPANVGEHFVPDGTGALVILKAGKAPPDRNTDDDSPGRIDFRNTRKLKPLEPLVDAIEAELVRLNTFVAGFPITGAVHHSFYRTFGMGDRSDFKWDKGGRVTSHGNYQTTKKVDRLGMTIGGEPIAELDVEASHLTLAYGLLGVPCESMSGAYEVDGLPSLVLDRKDWRRWAVKAWTTASLSAGKLKMRWPDGHRKAFRKGTGRELGEVFRPSKVAEAMVMKHPMLETYGTQGLTWAELQFAESQAIIAAMVSLMEEHGAPALPIHDSLTVRRGDLGVAKEALSQAYQALGTCPPSFSVHHQ